METLTMLAGSIIKNNCSFVLMINESVVFGIGHNFQDRSSVHQNDR